jgi:hypothetical protein
MVVETAVETVAQMAVEKVVRKVVAKVVENWAREAQGFLDQALVDVVAVESHSKAEGVVAA